MTECYACAKLAELRAENSQLRVKVDELANDGKAPEKVVTTESVDANDGNAALDSREKLEADANGYVVSWWQSYWVDSFAHADSMKRDIMRLLDRQAAITDAEWDDELEQLHMGYKPLIAELQAKVDELTAELEAAHVKNRSLRTHIAKMQEGRHGWHVKGVELQREVDRLTRENISLARDLGECMAERDVLKRENAKLSDDEFYLRCTLVDMDGEVVG